MQTITHKIYLEIEVEVTGHYHKGSNGTYLQPHESATFEIDNVKWNHLDITASLNQDKFDFDELEIDILEKIEDN